MNRTKRQTPGMMPLPAAAIAALLLQFGTTSCATTTPSPPARTIAAADLRAIGRVDERFQSYNVESVEITGGNFWAPYPAPGDTPRTPVAGPHGVDFATDAYQKRDPLDLTRNQRLRTLTKALGPAYMRVSGSWANNIYFQDDDQPPAPPPAGYQGVMTRSQWAGAVDFAKAVDAKILTSFATGEGAKNPDGSWNPEGARRLLAFTHSLGAKIDAVELTNEPNVARPSYTPDRFARDIATLRQLLASTSPETKLVGPGSTGEAGFKLFPSPAPEEASTNRLLSGNPPPRFDVFSHHFYGAVSQRCKSLGDRRGKDVTTSPAEALSESWLSRADQAQTYYRALRDRFAPGAPIWITETAQTACGGDPWSSTFLDSFRYVDQLGRLARQDVSIVFHNTLAASDYALVDDRTWLPRPNYWAALLWRRLMGEVVLDTGANPGDLHVYAHCLRGVPGGVALVALNLNRTNPTAIALPLESERYTLTADKLESGTIDLNGATIALTGDGELPVIAPAQARRGSVVLAPASISYFAMKNAANPACR